MLSHKQSVTILMADDDPDDRMMAEEAMEEARLVNSFHTVEDGEQLLDYLNRRNGFEHLTDESLPGLILLDLNMPRKDGREALRDIKADPALRKIPIIVLTTSKAEEDIYRTYDLGVNSFIAKPVIFEELVEIMKTISKYWLDMVELPLEDRAAAEVAQVDLARLS